MFSPENCNFTKWTSRNVQTLFLIVEVSLNQILYANDVKNTVFKEIEGFDLRILNWRSQNYS